MTPQQGSILNHLASMPEVAHATVGRKDLRQILQETGGQLMARGTLWEIRSKYIGAGVYRVSTRPWKTEYR